MRDERRRRVGAAPGPDVEVEGAVRPAYGFLRARRGCRRRDSHGGFGEGVKAELRIGGLVRTQKPKYKLTEKQRFDLLLTGDEPEEAFDANKVGIIPFFDAANVPPENFARKFLANPEQVAGFPKRVVIEPGECAIVMLRLTTDGTAPGAYAGALIAGAARRAVAVRVVDATLPDDGSRPRTDGTQRIPDA